MKQTFGKSERLTSRPIIDRLFRRGSADVKTCYLFPFRVLYFTTEAPQVMPEVLFSVSSKKFKRAVDRNLIKRRCREAYRKNKVLLSRLPPQSRPSSMAFLYIAKEKLEFDVIENGMIRLLKAVRNQQSEVKSRTDRTPPTTGGIQENSL